MGARPKVDIVLPELTAAQMAIVRSPGRFKVVAAGRRFGKGVLAVCECCRRALLGQHCRYLAPSYASDSFQAAWRIAETLVAQMPATRISILHKMFDLRGLGGGWVQFKTCEEPDGLRGEAVDFTVFDEAAHLRNLQMIWEQCVRPSLMDRRGAAWFISTPRGHNFFEELFLRGGRVPGWAAFRYPTNSNPWIDPEEVEALRSSVPELVARQEIDAEFVQLAGALIRREHIHWVDTAPDCVAVVRSWDLAFTERTSGDWTVGIKVGVTADGGLIVLDVVRGRWEWPTAQRVIHETAITDGPTVRQGIETVGAQTAALQSLLADPTLVGVPFEPVRVLVDKITRALPLVSRIESGRLSVLRRNWSEALIDELSAFPECEHDDQVDALSGAVQMLGSPTGAISTPEDIRTPATLDVPRITIKESVKAEDFRI